MPIIITAFLYALLVFLATTIGSVTGNGGGIIVKPVMDMIGTFNATEISLLTSCMVLGMSLVSILKQAKSRKKAAYTQKVTRLRLFLLVVGATLGGCVGEVIFKLLTRDSLDALVTLIQNTILVLMIAFGYFYIFNRDRLKLNVTNVAAYPLVGLFLGMVSSFLGIGGGTLNVALIMLFFSLNIKEAVYSSLCIVLFSQLAKLILIAVAGGFSMLASPLMLTTLIFMVVTGVLGGLLGSLISSKLSDKATVYCFLAVQSAILVITIINIISILN